MRTPTPQALAEALGELVANPDVRALLLVIKRDISNPTKPANARRIEQHAVVETTGESLAEVIDLAARRGAR